MKRTFKKAIASLTAAAIACTSLAVTSFAAITNADGNWTLNLSNFSTVCGAEFKLQLAEGWEETGVGGQIAYQGDGLSWTSVEYGVSGQGEDVKNTDGVTVAVADDILTVVFDNETALFSETATWAQLFVTSDWGADITVNSCELIRTDDVVEEETDADYIVTRTNTITMTVDSSWWEELVITADDILGDSGISAANVVKVSFTPDVPQMFQVGYNSADGWTQPQYNSYIELDDIDFGNFEFKLCISADASTAFDVNFAVDVYTLPEGDYAFSNSVDIEAAGDYWDITTISKSDLIGDIDPTTIEKIEFKSANNFAIGYNSTEVQSTDEEGNENHWVSFDTGNSYEITDMDLSIDAEWFSVQLIGRVGTGTTTIEWKVYTKDALEEELLGTSASIEDGIIGLNFFMSFGDEVLADEGAHLLIDYADGSVEALAIADGEATDNGYKYSVYVDAKEMADDVTVQVVMSDGTVGKEYTQSVKAYANAILSAEAGTYTDETIALVKAMLVYGGYAQEYFKYNTENLASEGLDTDVSSATVNKIFAKYKEGTLPEGVEYVGSALVLNGTTKIRHFFTATDVSLLPEGYLQQGDYYYYQIESIYADGLGGMYTTTIGEWSIEYSALSYARAVINNSDNYSEELVNLVKSMVYLYEAANAV